MKVALALAALVFVLAPGRAGAAELAQCIDVDACFDDEQPAHPQQSLPLAAATTDCDDDTFKQAVGMCDEPRTSISVVPAPEHPPLECDGPSCLPQPAPIGAAGTHGIDLFQPVALTGAVNADAESSTSIHLDESGGPRPGFPLRIDRPPRR